MGLSEVSRLGTVCNHLNVNFLVDTEVQGTRRIGNPGNDGFLFDPFVFPP